MRPQHGLGVDDAEAVAESPRSRHILGMTKGRLIRVRNYRRDPAATIYIVAERESAAAIEILEKALAEVGSEYEDLGRVNDSLIETLRLEPGQFSRL
jgi:hypothetical protein